MIIDTAETAKPSLSKADETALRELVTELEQSWNAGDGDRFARSFSQDADFVHRFGGHVAGRDIIADAHRTILTGPYAGSTVRYTPRAIKLLAPGIALIHADAHLDAPRINASLDALWSVVARQTESGWVIVSFHNTLVEPVTI